MTAGQPRLLQASRQCNIPSTAKSVAFNVTAVSPTASGHVVMFAGGLPNTSSLEYTAGRTRANNMVSGLEVDGSVKAQAVQSSGTMLQVVIDVVGYFE